ncbi:MAG: tRNA pseudouridine(13) synthase TruD [archaeon]|nr:tRNA pseudouridine(13) synthase TruD [archaeon]
MPGKTDVKNTVRENEAGIIHYTTTSKGIGGETRRRIADFIVRETTPEKTLQNIAFGEWEEKRETQFKAPENPDGLEYLHVEMEKFNHDTNSALRKLTRHLQVSQKRVGYAGMKDKRAITVQRISIWNPDVSRLESFSSRYICLHNPKWSAEKITIGNLVGNDFELVVRNIQMEKKKLENETKKCLAEMENGVINYFGEQRFGGLRMVTHIVGREFVAGNLEKAVMTYLTHPAVGEEEEIAIARKNLSESGDFARAIREYPAKFRYERSIIHHLCRYPKDFVGAFQKLPKHLTYLFTHAYQSYLFNMAINQRLERKLGLGPIEGDVLEGGIPTVALPGFDSEFPAGAQGEIEKEILEKEGITPEDFRVRSFPELGCSGARRKIALVPKKIRLLEISDDELYEGALKLRIGFWLEKGSYATTILREMMKTQP